VAKVARGGSPTIRRRELGALLRALRTEHGLTAEEVTARLLFSPTKLSRIETGQSGASARDIRDLCQLYNVTDPRELENLMTLAREGKQRGWWQDYAILYGTYVGLEAEASSIDIYQSGVVPGLLQTEEYVRAMLKTQVPAGPAHARRGHPAAIPRRPGRSSAAPASGWAAGNGGPVAAARPVR
jgi:transcriptional regulator with XRE-family HTH domain